MISGAALSALWLGQSNGLWRGLFGPWTISSKVKLRNNANDVDDMLNTGTAWVPPNRSADPLGSDGANSGFVQALNNLANDAGLAPSSIRGVLSGRGGQGFASWYAGGARQLQLNRLVKVANDAGYGTAVGGPKFDVAGMQLGETDNSDTVAHAVPRGNAVLRVLKDEGLIDDSTPILICEASDTHVGTNNIMAGLIPGFPNRIYMPTRNLATLADGTHFDDPVGFGRLVADRLLFHWGF